MIVYHGTTKKFDHFDLAHLGEGEGKSKFGVGHYASSVYDTAALYAGKCKGETKYVYTLEIPELTDTNHIVSAKPPHNSIVEKVEEQIGQIPDEAKSLGKHFRKYVGNLLLGNKGTVKKMIGSLSTEGEIKVSKFLYEIGVLYLVWAHSQSNPDNGKINVAILDDSIIAIKKIEEVELDEKGKLKKKSSTRIAEFIKKYYPEYWGIQVYPIEQSVFFHKMTDEHWILSNMSSCPLEVEGVLFKNSEHLFQTLKFATSESVLAVYNNYITPKMTAKHYQKLEGHRREDWGQILVDIMKFCLQQKYEQCPEFRKELDSTKGFHIVELQDAKNDKESSRANGWGVKTKGQNYEGANLMGRLLMELRDGTMEYKLPEDWNKALVIIGENK
ncbi:MAG: DUF1768 domain-containing protein [Bacteroidaceae bacterium]|nr:DUF1768 domain-containing protein [Bacteroidaceae bacterium]